jgi:hypothetical protein
MSVGFGELTGKICSDILVILGKNESENHPEKERVVGRTKRGSASKFSVHPNVSMRQTWIAGLLSRTGRTLQEWVELVQEEGPETNRECRDWLVNTHGLGANTAGWIIERVAGQGLEEIDPVAYLKAADVYVESLFGGRNTRRWATYEAVMALAQSLGSEVKICPSKAAVSIYRRHLIAELRPLPLEDQLSLGLALGQGPVPPRFAETGGAEKKDRITHRLVLVSKTDLDAEAQSWLRRAYVLDA